MGLNRLASTWLAPVDAASLAAFRISFGLIMAWWCLDDLRTGRVYELYVVPRFHFTYYLFDWVRPWPGAGMSLQFAAMAILAACIALGFWYRLATVLFALAFTHFFLIDRAYYQNHYYLLLLTSWLLTILPLHRACSLDALERPTIRSQTAPAWMLWLVRFHVGLPYVFGGVAKLHPDWLAGEPMRHVLAANSRFPLVGPWFTTEAAVALFSWGGLLFDLAIVPLLLWKPTRLVAYALCLFFHVMNAMLFSIHIFPWFMIFATTIFFEPSWPRGVFGGARLVLPQPESRGWRSLNRKSRCGVCLIATYCAFHLVWPLRHYAYAGDASWNERGHYFAWHMMVRGKTSGARFYVTDSQTDRTWIADVRGLVNSEQISPMGRDPEMILQLAHYLRDEERRRHGRNVQVRALVLTSLNGRKPQLLIDPTFDLACEPRGFHTRPWIQPLTEPLRSVPWTVPVVEWERHVVLPPLPFLHASSSSPSRNHPEEHSNQRGGSYNGRH